MVAGLPEKDKPLSKRLPKHLAKIPDLVLIFCKFYGSVHPRGSHELSRDQVHRPETYLNTLVSLWGIRLLNAGFPRERTWRSNPRRRSYLVLILTRRYCLPPAAAAV